MEPSTPVFIGGIKSGLLAVFVAAAISALAVVVGFTVIPLTKGDELRDAARRLCAGLLASFTAGPALASYAIEQWTWLLTPWVKLLPNAPLWAYLGAATPFIAVTALVGFWLVAIVMRTVQSRGGKDLMQIAGELRGGDKS